MTNGGVAYVSKWLASLGLACALAMPAFAQAVPAAAAAPPTREEIERAAPPPAAAPPSKLSVSGGIERAPCPLADARFAGIQVTLKGAAFDHLRGLAADDLKPAYADYLGKAVPLSAICEIRDAAATILRRAGYIAAVQVPPQRITDGVVHFDVLMARLVRLQVRGNAGKSERLLAAYLNKLTEQPLFNEKEAERYLLLARDLPGYDVHLTLRPAGGAPGEVVGEVTATRVPLIVSANLQNYGSHEVGRWGALVSAQANDLLGFGDRLTIGLFNSLQTREQTVIQSGYDVRIGGEGLMVGGRFTYAWTRPDIGGGDPLKSHTMVASLEATYPVHRSQLWNLRAAGGLDVIDQDLRFQGTLVTRDHIRALYLRLDADYTDPLSIAGRPGYSVAMPKWRLAGSLEARRGLGILGASDPCGACNVLPIRSRPQGDPTATLIRFTGYAEYHPVPKIGFSLSPRLQYAFDPLLSYEQYSGGAYTVGRGYDPGAVIGDSGAGVSLEAQYGRLAPATRTSFAYQPYVFLDAAWTWNRKLPLEHDPQKIYSIGGGVRVAWGDRARLDLTVAEPLRRAPAQASRGDTRFLLSLTTRLVPWSSR